ncbi:transcription termination factor 1-like [Gigantopelta aegis]|uniref:transcription termination factor 1-like n=1 Tax=Gigantopelta aegis TaxID=1735272 RepID=UPI001B88CA70|nr:transcription termination factor 1-like [Gigantopelta aegis]
MENRPSKKKHKRHNNYEEQLLGEEIPPRSDTENDNKHKKKHKRNKHDEEQLLGEEMSFRSDTENKNKHKKKHKRNKHDEEQLLGEEMSFRSDTENENKHKKKHKRNKHDEEQLLGEEMSFRSDTENENKHKKKHKRNKHDEEQLLGEEMSFRSDTENENKHKKKHKRNKHDEEQLLGEEMSFRSDTENENKHKHKKAKRNKIMKETDSEWIEECSGPSNSCQRITTLEMPLSSSILEDENKHKHKKRKKKKILEETDSEQIDTDSEWIEECSDPSNSCQRITTLEMPLSSSILENENKHKHKKRKKKKKILVETESEHLEKCQRITTLEMPSSNSVSEGKNKHKKKKKILVETESEHLEECQRITTLEMPSSNSVSEGKNKHKKKKKILVKTDLSSEQIEEYFDSCARKAIRERSISEDTPVLNIKQEVTDKTTVPRTEPHSTFIPLKVSDAISDIIHGSSRVTVTQERSSEFLLNNFGIRLRQGKWTPKEDRILRKNYKKALKDIPEDDQQYILVLSNDLPIQLKNRIRKMRIDTKFYSTLGRRLNRLPISCSKRAKHLFHECTVKGVFSDAEKNELDRLVLVHGHNWKVIGKIMGRSVNSVTSYFHKHKPKGGKGPFTPLEQQQLADAVRDVKKEYGIPNDQHQNIPWAEIARRVPTRSVMQCKVHWLRRILTSDPSKSERVFSKVAKKKLLVELIYNAEIAHEYDINWTNIAKQISSKLTPQFLQYYWTRMKKTYVPDYSFMSFDELREFLFNKFHASSSKCV